MFKKIFGSSEPKEEKVLPWQSLEEVAQLDVIAEKSMVKPQLLFKHSTRCGISRMVLKQFVSDYNLDLNIDLHFLDLLSYRAVSDAIGTKFEVVHQSPQMLIIKNGVVVAHSSHGAINEMDLEKFV
ncbi:MAG: bacillithiol system redox-active protein YtxJ [Winogradskyella arenosi]